MTTFNFNVNDFPNLREEFGRSNYTNWITFLYDLGYKFRWNHYASNKKFVEMDEADFVWFSLRWS